jgi:hypothetical protein
LTAPFGIGLKALSPMPEPAVTAVADDAREVIAPAVRLTQKPGSAAK